MLSLTFRAQSRVAGAAISEREQMTVGARHSWTKLQFVCTSEQADSAVIGSAKGAMNVRQKAVIWATSLATLGRTRPVAGYRTLVLWLLQIRGKCDTISKGRFLMEASRAGQPQYGAKPLIVRVKNGIGHRQHAGLNIHRHHAAKLTDLLGDRDNKSPRTTADIQYGHAWLQS